MSPTLPNSFVNVLYPDVMIFEVGGHWEVTGFR